MFRPKKDTVPFAHTPGASAWPWPWLCKRAVECGGAQRYLVSCEFAKQLTNPLHLKNSNSLEWFWNFQLFPLIPLDIIWEVVQNILSLGFCSSLEFTGILCLCKFDFCFFLTFGVTMLIHLKILWAQTFMDLKANYDNFIIQLGSFSSRLLGCRLEKGMATHSNIFAWRIPWTEEPGRLQSMRSQRVGRDWVSYTLKYKWKEYAT